MRRLQSLLAVMFAAMTLASAAACNQIAGIHEPIDRDGSVAGDGGNEGDAHVAPEASPDDPAAAYIGDWHGRGSGSLSLTCNGDTQTTKPDPSTITITRVDGQLRYLDPPCAFDATLTAAGLSLGADQTCAIDDSVNGEPVTDHLTLGRPAIFKLGADKRSATTTINGTVDVISKVSGATQSCTVQQSDTFDKL